MAHHLTRPGKRLAILLATLVSASRLEAAESLDLFLNHLLQGKQGGVIVADPRTGRILSVWNPKTAFEEAYPPGSTAKLVVSAAVLQEGLIAPSETILCRHIPRLLGESYRCSHPPADQPFDMVGALANSCNYFFSEVSTRLSSSALARWYALFGFGIAGEGGESGEVRVGDNAREKALAALGERGITATPAQVLLAYSALAMQGKMYRLMLPGQHPPPALLRIIPLERATVRILSEGLVDCVQNGMGHAAAVPGVPVAGKTGTAAALDGSGKTHAWFVGYAPADSPEVALVVFLRRGTGAGSAAPLAGRILTWYFDHRSHAR